MGRGVTEAAIAASLLGSILRTAVFIGFSKAPFAAQAARVRSARIATSIMPPITDRCSTAK